MPVIRNKRTGETMYVPDAGPQMPAKPTFELEAPKMRGDIDSTAAGTKRTVVQTAGDVLDNQNKGRTIHQNPISDRDQALINGMRLKQGDLTGVLQDIQGAQRAVDRFKPAPGKGTDYAASIPTDADSWFTANVFRPIGAWWNDVDPALAQDYQTLSGLQNQSVLNSQIAQAGPQTESDAVRMKLAGVSPNKDVRPNAQLLAEQQYRTQMGIEKPSFYTYWANKLGSTTALNSEGQSADQVWNQQFQRGYQQMRRDPRYTGTLGNARSAPRKQSNVIDFDKWGN